MVFVWMFLITLISMSFWGLLPDRLCNRYTSLAIIFMRVQTLLIFFSVLGVSGWALSQSLPLDLSFIQLGSHRLGFYFDGLSLTMLTLVSFMTAIAGQFSVRYLDGEPMQGRFLKWLCITAASVLLFIASNHLLLFLVAWTASSLGLHQLLTHYSDRTQALLAARKKFVVSRLGDAFLIGAFGLIYHALGSWNYTSLFAHLKTHTPDGFAIQLACFLLVAGAMTKSAQFPVHSWLPETMETPTPVSAFMHAGIINAGGFLILRLSPLLVKFPFALGTLACVGGFTALFAVLVMLTQTSIKKRLAYSTISQMGFMMLQCGLGAFTAATIHIVAHSLYKAHSFLNSGSFLKEVKQARHLSQAAYPSFSAIHFSGLALLNLALCALAAWIWQVPVFTKPGGIILLIILSLGFTSLGVQAYENAPRDFFPWSPLFSFCGGFLYFAIYRVFDGFLHPIFERLNPSRPLEVGLGIAMVLGFITVFFLEKRLRRHAESPVLRRLYILIRNEFYADIYLKRVSGWTFVPRAHRSPKPSPKEEFYV
jgi:NAD(P)H-quinone oxidoreductase subunit 5